MNAHFDKIDDSLAHIKENLSNHPLYSHLETVEDIRVFAGQHAFAVWDFMSLLKALQIELTCTRSPWTPSGNGKIVRFINEIVWAEESDVLDDGTVMSHYEMYIDAMKDLGADTRQIEYFVARVADGDSPGEALEHVEIHEYTKKFVKTTFDIIARNKAHEIAAAFTFGREDLIPDMFIQILRKANKDGLNTAKFTYYLERHIELDGDEHGPLALKMINELCGDDILKWQEVETTAIKCLEARYELWAAAQNMIINNRIQH